MPLQTGASAPDFTLPSGPKETLTLRAYQDGQPVVLLFFPLAYSSVCTREMCMVGEDYGAYRELGARVLGISVDSPFVNQKFAEDCGVPFPILSDFNREVIEKYGVRRQAPLGPGLLGVADRAAFVVDGQGRVAYAWQSENPADLPPFDEIKAALAQAR